MMRPMIRRDSCDMLTDEDEDDEDDDVEDRCDERAVIDSILDASASRGSGGRVSSDSPTVAADAGHDADFEDENDVSGMTRMMMSPSSDEYIAS